MKLFVPKEADAAETRVPLLPTDAGRLVQLGADVEVEGGIGESINIPDQAYEEVGAQIARDRAASLSSADTVLRIGMPAGEDIVALAAGCIHISYMDPFNNVEAVRKLAAQRISGISLEMIPRTTIAQKMDVLSSQANLAGYVAVVLAAERLQKIFPMMMTAAGTIAPARVFVIGAGVAGLQAIATAKRLGARVDAFDVRPEAQEQILSLGAKPLNMDLGPTGKTKDGYAKQLTDEQLGKKRLAMAKQCAQSDVVITTAKVFGKKAPLIVTNEMLDGMKPGSVVIDLAVETGGNVQASELGKEVDRNGVTIIGRPELERMVPVPASQVFSSNLYSFLEHFWDKEAKSFRLDREDEIIRSCLITHEGEVVHPTIRDAIG
ncbi:MAG: NAD(P) transhydrogenase subunit alpha [Phycisphaerae bacterium SG8_4]|nr:MAG: NAD(P) transhydrogenase subunit alpha [Phycisphaerae bacterium SG8_4]